MTKDLKKGETVRLKSGGPIMTISSIDSDEFGTTVFCMWFVKDDLKQGNFPPEVLEPA